MHVCGELPNPSAMIQNIFLHKGQCEEQPHDALYLRVTGGWLIWPRAAVRPLCAGDYVVATDLMAQIKQM